MAETKEKEGKPSRKARKKLPPKGTAARLRHAVGLWAHKSPEEIDEIRNIIYSTRKSSS
jgi:hypothetical protein